MPQTRGLQKPLTSICFLEWEAFWGGLVPAVTLTLMNPEVGAQGSTGLEHHDHLRSAG